MISASSIPVYIFNPFALISSKCSHASLLQDYLSKSCNTAVIIDCSVVSESKTDFFSEIFNGILKDQSQASLMKISYHFSEFISIFNEIKPTRDIVLIFNNASRLNLSYLDDFVRLWERKSRDFQTLPQLKFIFDDSVSFLGMESRLRDRFSVKEVACPNVNDIFNELIEEIIRNNLPILLDPQLMKRFVSLSSTETFNTILKQIKFLIIMSFNNPRDTHNTRISDCNGLLKDLYLFISNLSKRLITVRPSSPRHSPTFDFYPLIFNGILIDSQAFNEVVNELKSCSPNEFVAIMSAERDDNSKVSSVIREFVDSNIIKAMKERVDSTLNTKSVLKDFQFDLVKKLCDYLKTIVVEIPAGTVVLNDERGNLRRAFEADPQFALQMALKYPSVYLNCSDCSSERSGFNLINSNTLSSSLNTLMAPIHHNRPNMLDSCLLYRISLEFCSKSINLITWYKSFLAVIESKTPTPLVAARFFKALNELQLAGMVSEFGRTKRKRKFVDRFNITDSLDQD